MAEPLRIQRRRTKGWRMPPNTISVCRPGPWGNAYRPSPAIQDDYFGGSIPALTAADCARLYGEHLQGCLAGQFGPSLRDRLASLRGRNLACWCHLCPTHTAGKPLGLPCPDCAPCHADPLGLIVQAELRCDAPEASDG